MKKYIILILALLLPFMPIGAVEGYWDKNEYDLGRKAETFSFTYEFDSDDYGTGVHDEVFFKLVLLQKMDVICSTRGSETEDTYILLYDHMRITTIASNDYVGEDDQAHLVLEGLDAGTYYFSITNHGSRKGIKLLISGKCNNPDSENFIGSFNEESVYNCTVNTANYADSYGLPTSDVSYSFTTSKTFDLDVYATFTSPASSGYVKVYLLDENNNLISEYGWYENLPAGSYKFIIEGSVTDGEISVEISLAYPRPDYYYDTDIFNGPGSFTTEEWPDDYPDIVGNETGDVILHFELEKAMRVHINQTGGSEQHTRFYLWNAEMQEIATDMSHPSDIPPVSSGYAAMSINLDEGRYYVVCESLDEYTEDTDRTVVFLIKCEDGSISAGDTTYNYILTHTLTGKGDYHYLDKITYYDGLGRPEQTVSRKARAHGLDLVTIQEYDAFGREASAWLPRAAATGNDGKYVKLSTFRTLSPELYVGDTKAYTQPVYEASPLKRILEEYGAGEQWHDNGKSRKYAHMANVQGNDTLNCACFVVEYDVENDTLMTLKRRGSYATGTLSVLCTTDEDGNRTFEFTDKLGRTVMTRSMNGNEKLDTYHVWNLYGKPYAVLPPAASDAMANSNDTCWVSTHEVLKKHAYLYRYHAERGTLCTAKKLPGSGWILYRYDQNNRLIFKQDAVMRRQGKWQFTLPDMYGRICMTGMCENTESSLQNLLGKSVVAEKDRASAYGYSIRDNTVTLVNPTAHAVNFYDDYSFRNLQYFTNTVLDYTVENGYDTRYYSDRAEGLLTGTLTAMMNGSTVTGYQPSAMYYDYRGRLIQTKSGNHLGGVEKEWLALDFTGNVTKRKHVHTATGETTQTEVYTYTYDHAGRLLTVKYTLNGGTEVTLTANE